MLIWDTGLKSQYPGCELHLTNVNWLGARREEQRSLTSGISFSDDHDSG